MLSTEVCFIQVFIYPSYTPLYSIFPLMNSRLIFTPPCPTLALASNIYTLLTSIPPSKILIFSITHHYYIRHNSQQTHAIFLPYMVFQCRHNIRNQPVPTTIPFPNSSCDITTIETHKLFGKILKTFFSIFLQDSMALRQTRHTGKHY